MKGHAVSVGHQRLALRKSIFVMDSKGLCQLPSSALWIKTHNQCDEEVQDYTLTRTTVIISCKPWDVGCASFCVYLRADFLYNTTDSHIIVHNKTQYMMCVCIDNKHVTYIYIYMYTYYDNMYNIHIIHVVHTISIARIYTHTLHWQQVFWMASHADRPKVAMCHECCGLDSNIASQPTGPPRFTTSFRHDFMTSRPNHSILQNHLCAFSGPIHEFWNTKGYVAEDEDGDAMCSVVYVGLKY